MGTILIWKVHHWTKNSLLRDSCGFFEVLVVLDDGSYVSRRVEEVTSKTGGSDSKNKEK